MKICGAIFDLDGTLVDSLFFWKRLWEKVGIRFWNDPHFTVPEELDEKVRTTTLKECAEIIQKEFGIQESAETVFDFFNDSLIDFYKEEVKPKENVEKALKTLKQENVKMCVASATDSETVKKVLEIFHLDPYFEGVVSCADKDVLAGKDQPAVYEKALQLLGTPRNQTVVFEDSFVALETAGRMGCVTVGIFDENNYGQERLKNASRIYVGRDENMFDAVTELLEPGTDSSELAEL